MPGIVGTAERLDEDPPLGLHPRTSVDRAAAVLFAFGPEECVGVTEIAHRAGMPKTTAHRLLAILERQGLVTRHGTKFQLGTNLYELAGRVPFGPGGRLKPVGSKYLYDLNERTRHTAHLAVMDGLDLLCVTKVAGPDSPPVPTAIGRRQAAHCTALGKAMLAYSTVDLFRDVVVHRGLPPLTRQTIVLPALFAKHLRSVHEHGVAYDRQECVVGVECVAVPILDRKGTAVGAISVSGGSSVERFTPLLVSASQSISRELANLPSAPRGTPSS